MRLRYFTGSLTEFLNLVIKVTRTDLMCLAPLLIRKSTQAALMNQRKPLHALIMAQFMQIWNPGCYSSLTVYIIMRVMISIILMVIAALVGFFFGAGMSEAMGGAILLSMITGFACTISAIEKNKKD